MRIERASNQAIQYACKNYHYAKLVAPRCYDLAFSIFNNNNEWCGVICYGKGGTPTIAKPYGMKQGQVIELIRVALNGKQEQTSKAVALTLKMLPKYAPMARLVISYADKGQDHIGTIYQASNWIYTGGSKSSGQEYYVNGKRTHPSSIKYMNIDRANLPKRAMSGKHKYIYPLDKSLVEYCQQLSKPYPKKAAAEETESGDQPGTGGLSPTLPLQFSDERQPR